MNRDNIYSKSGKANKSLTAFSLGTYCALTGKIIQLKILREKIFDEKDQYDIIVDVFLVCQRRGE